MKRLKWFTIASLMVVGALLMSAVFAAGMMPVSAGKNPPPGGKSEPPAGSKPPDERGPRNPGTEPDPCEAAGNCGPGDHGMGKPINGSEHANCRAAGSEVDPKCAPPVTTPRATPGSTPVPSATPGGTPPVGDPVIGPPTTLPACSPLSCWATFVCDFIAGKVKLVATTEEVDRDSSGAIVGTKAMTTTVGLAR